MLNKKIRKRTTYITIFIMFIGFQTDLFACQCARISYSFNRVLNQNSIVVYAELINPANGMDGYSKFRIITDYNNSIDKDTITLFSGGLDCTQFFACDSNCKWIIILFENFAQNGEMIYSASSCVESALLVEDNENVVRGNISRTNSFMIRILYGMRIFEFPENKKKFDRFDKRLKRKYSTTAQHAV